MSHTEHVSRPSLASVALTIFWVAYGIGAVWVMYLATPPVSRNVIEILVGYTGILVIVTLAILLRARLKRGRAARGS